MIGQFWPIICVRYCPIVIGQCTNAVIWLVPNSQFWLVSVNHFWLVNGLGPVRSDSGVFVCDRFFAFGNSRLFPERGSVMSGSEMNGARFDMANKDVIFSCDQAALWMVQSVCPSVCLSVRPSVRPSVCHTFLTMFPSSYHHEIFRSYYQWQKWRPCKRSRSEVKGQGHRGHDPNFRFRTVTPVWIHIWWWNDTYSLMLLRRGALLFFKVIRQISRSHGAKIAEFDPDWAFPDCNSSLNSPMATKWCTKLEVA